jgi:hypothetical protein
MKTVLGALGITAPFLIGCKAVDDPDAWKVPATDPRGAIISAEGENIEPSLEFAIDAQRFYLKRLYQKANPKQQNEFRAMQRYRLAETVLSV